MNVFLIILVLVFSIVPSIFLIGIGIASVFILKKDLFESNSQKVG